MYKEASVKMKALRMLAKNKAFKKFKKFDDAGKQFYPKTRKVFYGSQISPVPGPGTAMAGIYGGLTGGTMAASKLHRDYPKTYNYLMTVARTVAQ